MATTIGSLILELGLDATTFNRDLNAAKRQAESVARLFATQTITPRFDHRELTRLNQHLTLKQQHWRQVQRDFSKPLKISVDFSQLDALERRIKNIKTSATTIGVNVSSTGQTQNQRGLAEEIGKAVARHSKSGGGIGSAIGSAISLPGRVSAQAVGKIGEGIIFGITQEVSRSLGKGLSNALEKSISGAFGSSELIGEKIGGKIAGEVVGSFAQRMGGIPAALESAIDKIQSPKLKANLKKKLEELKDVPAALQSEVIQTLGSQNIIQEGLYQRGRMQRETRRRLPVAQEQSAQEWRQSLSERDRIEAMAAARLQRNQQKRASLTPQVESATNRFRQAQSDLKAMEEMGATSDTLSIFAKQLTESSAKLRGLTEALDDLNKQDALAQKAITEARGRVKTGFQRVKVLAPREQPAAYRDLVQSVAGNLNPSRIPQLRVADASLKKDGAVSQYDPARNAIEVTREMFEAIKAGTLSRDQILTLREELEHAVDFDFGSFQGIQASRNNRIVGAPVSYTDAEFQSVAAELGAYSPDRRALELNAKVKAMRGVDASVAQQRQRFLLQNVPTLAANRPAAEGRVQQFSQQLRQYETFAKQAGNDVSKAVNVYRQVFQQIANQITTLADEVVSSTSTLDQSDVESVAGKMAQYWQGLEEVNQKLIAAGEKQIEEAVRLGRHDQGLGAAYTPMGVESPTVEREFLDPKQDPWNVQPSVAGRIERAGAAIAQGSAPIRQRLATMGRIAGRGAGQLAYGAGVLAGGAYDAGVNMLASPQAAALSKQLGQSGAALARVAQTGLALAQGMESLTLAVIPYGQQIKAVTQHVALPAATFAAATHFLPGGAQAGQMLVEGAQGMMAPLAHGAGGSLGAQAAELISSGLPNAFGIQGAVSGAISGAVETAMSGIGSAVAQGAAVLLGGKAIQSAGMLPAQAVGRMVSKRGTNAPALPAANIPLALPSADKELIPIAAQTQQQAQKLTRSEKKDLAKQQELANRKAAIEMANKAGQVAGNAAATVQATVESAKAEADRLNKAFSRLYQGLKNATKEGNDFLVQAYGQQLQDLEARSQEQINALINDARESNNLPLLGQLGGVKGQMSRRQKLTQKLLSEYQPTNSGGLTEEETGENLKAQRMLEFGRRGLNPNRAANAAEAEHLRHINELLNDAIQAADRYDAAIKRAMRSANAEYEKHAAAAEKALNPDYAELNQRVESRISGVDETIKELDAGYAARSKAALDQAEEQERYRQAYAEMMGLESDSMEAMALPPPPPGGPGGGFFNALTGDIGDLIGAVGGIPGAAKLAVGSLLGFTAVAVIGPILGNIARTASEAAISFEQLSVQFDSALGAKGAEALADATQRAIDMKVGIDQARQSYLQFGTAVRDTPMESIAELANDALTQAAVTRGLSGDQFDRARIAVTQMVSKGGPIQSEEVRGQLAEALPGSTAIFARALGMSQSEFSANLVQGNISGADAVPKFLAQLQAETSTGVDQSLNTTAAAITNLQNQTQLLQETLGKPLLPVQKLGIDALAGGIQLAANYIDELVQLLGAAAIASVLQFAAANLKASSAVGLFNAAVGLSGNLLKVMGGFLKQPANSLAGFTVGTFAAIEAIKIMGKAFGDSGGAAREFADSADRAFRKYAESQKIAQGGAEAFKGDTGETLLEDSIVGTIFGKKNAARFERSFQEVYGMRTYGQKAAEDQYIARQDAIAASNRVLTGDGETQGIYGLLQSAKNGGGDLAELAKLNQQMRDIQSRRLALQPGDDAGRATLAEEERKIRQQQTSIEGRVRGLSAQNAAAIESFKRMRDEAERMGDVQGAEELTRQIDVLTKAQDMFNKAISQSVKSVAQLEAQFNRIQGTLKENNQQTDIAAAGVKTAVANNAALTTGQREFALLTQSQDELAQRIAANKQALAEMVSLLNEAETQRVLGINEFNNESSPSAIRERTATMPDSQDKERLELAADQMEGIRGLQAESANLTAQMAESQQQARQRMIDLGKEIANFYRQVGRDVQEMQRTVEGLNLEAEFTRTKTQIEASLGKFRNTFFDDLISGVAGLVDILQEIAQIPLQAQGQVAGLKNQMQDNMLNATQMNQQLPGGNTTPFKGVIVTSAVDASGEPGLDYVVENGKRGAQFGALAGGEVIETVTDQNWESHLEAGGTQRGYGNRVIVRTVDEVTGEFVDMLYAHLDQVAVQVGQRVGVGTVLGTQGRTGSTTGAHVSVDFFGKDSNATTPAAINMRDRIAQTLASNPDALNQQIQATPTTQPQAASAPMGQSLFAGGSRSLAARVVGVSEGTRTAEGGFTSAYAGHADPGNGRRNQGSFSYQHQAWSGEDADEKWNKQLESVFGGFVEAAKKAGLDPNNPELAFNFLDLYTQSPAAATERGGFLDQLPAIAQGRSILDARVASYVNPNTGELDAPGFGNSEARLRADQERRMSAVRQGIQANNLQSSGNLSVNPANAALINQGVTQFNNAANANIAAVNNNAAAQVEAQIQRGINLLESQGIQLEANMREVEDETIQAQRRAREAQFDSMRQTPDVQLQREIFGLENRAQDVERSLGLPKMERSLELLQKVREEMSGLQLPPELQEQQQAYLQQLDESIPLLEERIAVTRKAAEEETAALRETIKLKEEDFKISQERRRLEARQATSQMRGEMGQAQIEMARRRQYDFGGLMGAASLEYQMGVEQVQLGNAAKRSNIEEQLRMAGEDEELTAELQKQLELLQQMEQVSLQNLQDQFTQTRDAVQMSSLEMDRRIFDSGAAVLQEQSSGLRAMGLTTQADRLDKQVAVGQVGMDLSQTLSQINQMEQSMGLAAEQAQVLRNNAMALSEVKLDNINNQFSAMGQLMPSIQGAFGGFFTSIITGSESIEDAFKNMLMNIANSLAQFGVNMLMNELFGSLMGMGGGAMGQMGMGGPMGGGMGGGVLGIASTVLGSLFGGGGMSMGFGSGVMGAASGVMGLFADGGVVGKASKTARSIEDAMRMEGPKAELVVASKGELILPIDKTREFYARGLDKVLNFKQGGIVGGGRAPQGPTFKEGGNNNVSININMGKGGETQTDRRGAGKLATQIEGAVLEILTRERRPGGLLT